MIKKNNKDWVWSDVAIDYDAGLIKGKDGCLKPKKIGCYVRSMEYSRRIAKWI